MKTLSKKLSAAGVLALVLSPALALAPSGADRGT